MVSGDKSNMTYTTVEPSSSSAVVYHKATGSSPTEAEDASTMYVGMLYVSGVLITGCILFLMVPQDNSVSYDIANVSVVRDWFVNGNMLNNTISSTQSVFNECIALFL